MTAGIDFVYRQKNTKIWFHFLAFSILIFWHWSVKRSDFSHHFILSEKLKNTNKLTKTTNPQNRKFSKKNKQNPKTTILEYFGAFQYFPILEWKVSQNRSFWWEFLIKVRLLVNNQDFHQMSKILTKDFGRKINILVKNQTYNFRGQFYASVK